MPTTSSTLASADLATLCAARTAALRVYDAACYADGVAGSVWRLIASDITAACDALEGHVGAEALRSTRARATDASQRGQYADRMVAAAARQWASRQSVPVVAIEVAS